MTAIFLKTFSDSPETQSSDFSAFLPEPMWMIHIKFYNNLKKQAEKMEWEKMEWDNTARVLGQHMCFLKTILLFL